MSCLPARSIPGENARAAETTPPLVISARTEASLRELVRCWCSTLAATPGERVPVLMRAAARKRDHHAHRLVALGKDLATTA